MCYSIVFTMISFSLHSYTHATSLSALLVHPPGAQSADVIRAFFYTTWTQTLLDLYTQKIVDTQLELQ